MPENKSSFAPAEWQLCGATADVKQHMSHQKVLTKNNINHLLVQGQQAEGGILSLYLGQSWGLSKDVEELKRVQQKAMKTTRDENT